MKRREFITLIGSAATTWPLAARAQQPSMPVVGFIRDGSTEGSARHVAGFRQGRNETGYVEGQNEAGLSKPRLLDHSRAVVTALAPGVTQRLADGGGANSRLQAGCGT